MIMHFKLQKFEASCQPLLAGKEAEARIICPKGTQILATLSWDIQTKRGHNVLRTNACLKRGLSMVEAWPVAMFAEVVCLKVGQC